MQAGVSAGLCGGRRRKPKECNGNGHRQYTHERYPHFLGRKRVKIEPTAKPGRRAKTARGHSMVVLNRIYTRTGDDGTTSLGTGARRKKYDLRVEAYGSLGEANAVIGLGRLHTARQ